jgi:hypothetical protein
MYGMSNYSRGLQAAIFLIGVVIIKGDGEIVDVINEMGFIVGDALVPRT